MPSKVREVASGTDPSEAKVSFFNKRTFLGAQACPWNHFVIHLVGFMITWAHKILANTPTHPITIWEFFMWDYSVASVPTPDWSFAGMTILAGQKPKTFQQYCFQFEIMKTLTKHYQNMCVRLERLCLNTQFLVVQSTSSQHVSL